MYGMFNVVISVAGIFYVEHFLRCMTHEGKLSIFSDLEVAISAALHESFARSKYAYSVSHFLLY